jgi:hypothetical protein
MSINTTGGRKSTKKPKKKVKQPPKIKKRTSDAITASTGTPSVPDLSTQPPPVKKTKTAGVYTGTVTPGPFTIAEHTDLPAMKVVKLLPNIAVKAGVIEAVEFGRNRTPSPFGSKMGDHTASWSSVADDVHAHLYSKKLPEALTDLETMQTHAQDWLTDPASLGMRLWNMLGPDERASRQPALEDWAFKVKDAIAQARTALAAGGTAPDPAAVDTNVGELLAQATAHHLAFLNFLPFATVPAAGERSIGSGEGVARAKVLSIEMDVEAERQLKEETPEEKTARLKQEAADKAAKEKGETAPQTRKREAQEAAAANAAKVKQLSDAGKGLW